MKAIAKMLDNFFKQSSIWIYDILYYTIKPDGLPMTLHLRVEGQMVYGKSLLRSSVWAECYLK